MIPEHLKFGGGVSDSMMHPAVLVVVLLASLLIWFLPKNRVMVPFLVVGLLSPGGQVLVIGGQHFLALRIITLAGVLRILFAKRQGWDSLDKLFVAWILLRVTAFCLLFANTGAVVNQVAFLLDYLGGFFLLRFAVQKQEDIERLIRTLAYIAVFLAACMLFERLAAINVFGYLGGSTAPTIRDGAIRSRGPFAHALLAGTFGATLLPLFYWLWVDGRSRMVAIAGVGATAIITITSASSTPVLAFGAGLVGIALWPLRNHLGILRMGTVAMLVLLHLTMKAPVWFLIARVDLVGGSSGFHRAMLIDQFITHFWDWWLIGTDSNGSWGWDMWDTCNQFVTEGYTGGVATFACFVAILWLCFRRLGKTRRANAKNKKREWFLWLLGVTLLTHVVAFFGIVYFDQTRLSWFAMLAMIIAATASLKKGNGVPGQVSVGDSALALPEPGIQFNEPAKPEAREEEPWGAWKS